MRATVLFGAGDVRVEDVPGARPVEPTDVVVRVTRARICGSDLWPYAGADPSDTDRRMSHEAVGVVEEVAPTSAPRRSGTWSSCRERARRGGGRARA